jgi:hypothetical protein
MLPMLMMKKYGPAIFGITVLIILIILSATDVIPVKSMFGGGGGGKDLDEEDKKVALKLDKIVKDIVIPMHENDADGAAIPNAVISKMEAQAAGIVSLATMEEAKRKGIFQGSTEWVKLSKEQKTVGGSVFVIAEQQKTVEGFKEFTGFVKSLNDAVVASKVSGITTDSTKEEACEPLTDSTALTGSMLTDDDGEKLPIQPMAYSGPMQDYIAALAENEQLDKECIDLSVIAEEI